MQPSSTSDETQKWANKELLFVYLFIYSLLIFYFTCYKEREKKSQRKNFHEFMELKDYELFLMGNNKIVMKSITFHHITHGLFVVFHV